VKLLRGALFAGGLYSGALLGALAPSGVSPRDTAPAPVTVTHHVRGVIRYDDPIVAYARQQQDGYIVVEEPLGGVSTEAQGPAGIVIKRPQGSSTAGVGKTVAVSRDSSTESSVG